MLKNIISPVHIWKKSGETYYQTLEKMQISANKSTVSTSLH